MKKLLFFYSDTCAPCVALKDKLPIAVADLDVELEQLNIDENRALAAQMMVFSVPTVILLEGDKEIKRWSGYFSVFDIVETISGERIWDV